MIKRFIPLGFLLIALTCSAQKMGELFKTMPQYVLPGFSEADKIMLLVDTALTSIPYPLGNIERINYTDDFLKIKTSSRGTLQIKLLPLINNTKIVCVVKTVCGQACDSQIQFYSTEWNPIESEPLLPHLSAEMFFDRSQKNNIDFEKALRLIDMEPIKAEFKGGSDDLTLILDYESYVSAENVELIKSFIKQDSITLRWNKTSFQN
jgi:hypothetical protein